MTVDRTGVIVPCPSCGRSNRLAFETLGRAARCGHCKTALAAPAAPVEIGDAASFDAAVARSALPLVVDFWAPWCGPCRMMAPELERVARSTAGQYLVLKVNTDEHQELGARFRIQSIPTLAVIAGGREVERMAGARTAADIRAFVDRAVATHQRRAS